MCDVVPFRDEYAEGVIRVVKAVFDEYGFTWEADGYCSDLYDPRQYYISPGGMFWVVLDGVDVIGCVAVKLHAEQSELHRMYLLQSYRGRGLGRRLLETCLDYARQHHCASMRAWSDVKLPDAHRLYLKHGFVRDGERICDDPDQSREHGFWKGPM